MTLTINISDQDYMINISDQDINYQDVIINISDQDPGSIILSSQDAKSKLIKYALIKLSTSVHLEILITL